MKYENIKSIILGILVLNSLVLTWNLWTYQPNYERLENTNYVQEVTFGEQLEWDRILKPETILYHFKDFHTGTTNSGEIDRALHEISSWNIFNFKNMTNEVKSVPEFVHAEGNVEIIFPDVLPMEIYRQILNIKEKKTPNFKFNRIVINVGNKTKEDGAIYFVNYGSLKDKQIFEGHVKSADLKQFLNQYYNTSDQLTRYTPFKATDEKTIFFPENQTKMISYKYFLNRLDPEKFKDALFSDPSFVQKNFVTNNEEYTDGSSLMTVNNDTRMLSYVNPADESNVIMSSGDLLKKSLEFVNSHGGWTGNYRYDDLDEVNQKVTYRLHDSAGFPLFNEYGMSEIVQVWGEKEIHKYLRPSFDIDIQLRTETKEVILSSGSEVLEFIKKKKGFQAEALEDLVLGYRMSKDSKESQLINLEPSWFYRYDNTWAQITTEELGGLNHGLE
jgi:regulatory protein YycH of two-component signal transduction system YycFG